MQLRSFQTAHASRLLAILRERKSAMDASFPGAGKSYCAAWVASQLKVETLVIAPLSVCIPWRTILSDCGVDAIVTNYEMAVRHCGTVKPWGAGSYFEFTKRCPLIVFDECHRLTGDTTLNSKLAIAAKRQGSMILTLSATAATTILKMKALGYVHDLHHLSDYRPWLFARGVKEIALKFGRRTVKKLVISKADDAKAMAQLHEEIFGSGSRGSRLRIENIPDFPKAMTEVLLLSDPPAAVRQLSEEMQRFYRQRTILAAYSADELAQLTHWRIAAEVAKIPQIIDMAEDAMEGTKVAVFINFRVTLDELCIKATVRGWKFDCIHGEQTAGARQKAIEAFQANKLDIIFVNIMAGGQGVSLHDPVSQLPRTALVCPSWTAIDLRQSLGRCHRDGGGFTRNFLLYWSTGVEARVASAVRRKLDNLSLLNDAELSEFAESNAEPSLAL